MTRLFTFRDPGIYDDGPLPDGLLIDPKVTGFVERDRPHRPLPKSIPDYETRGIVMPSWFAVVLAVAGVVLFAMFALWVVEL